MTRAASPPKAPSKWHLHKTTNFQVFAATAGQAKQIAAACERLRRDLRETWLVQKADQAWQPCCCIVAHPSWQSFTAGVGRGPGQSRGCSTVRVDKGRILARRIDLRCDDCDPLTAALPHELAHVVLADRFLDKPLPRWADEGIALLSDPPTKRAGHDRDLWIAIASGSRIPLAALLHMHEYPAGQVPAFYAQSSSLVSFLVNRSTEAKFVNFVEYAMRNGYDAALRDEYGLRNVVELEQLWTHETLVQIARSSQKPSPNKSVRHYYALNLEPQ
jgi:hypothetical protein